jgi:hypothetical protein
MLFESIPLVLNPKYKRMKAVNYLLIPCFFLMLSTSALHKYYVSVTQVEYVKEKKAVQITTRIFIDDFEKLLRERFDATITLASNKDEKQIDSYIETYIKSKLKISINGESVDYTFLGKEYDEDIVQCFIEIKNIENIQTFEITNQVLFDQFEEQKNVVRTYINSKHKSFILIPQNDKGMLNF